MYDCVSKTLYCLEAIHEIIIYTNIDRATPQLLLKHFQKFRTVLNTYLFP